MFYFKSGMRSTKHFLQANFKTTLKINLHDGCYQSYYAITYYKNYIETI